MFQTKVSFFNVALCNKTWEFPLKKTKVNQFSPNAAPSIRNKKKSLDKIDVFLNIESESAIKSRGFHLRVQSYPQPHLQEGAGGG